MDEDPEHLFLILNDSTNLYEAGAFFVILAMFILIIVSALISGSEVAFFSLDIKNLNNDENNQLKSIKQLLKKPNQLLATILIANNFVNVAIIILSTYLSDLWFEQINIPWLKFFIQVIAVTFLLLLFGEVIPKIVAHQKSLAFARLMQNPLSVLQKIFYPLSKILVSSTSLIEKRFKAKGYQISIDDLSSALDLAGEKDTNDNEKRILRSIVEFGNIQAKEIMKSRVDVLALENTMSFKDIKNIIIDCGYSRIPVYKDNFDTILGIIYIKDLLPYLNKTNFDWNKLIRAPFFVPETKMIDDLLKEFQEKKIHLAIVVDEYGGSSGIVTLEDILEEIVGDINDEFDDDGIMYSKLDANNFIFEGKTSLNDVLKTLDLEYNLFDSVKGESDTLAGLILELKGNIPQKNEQLEFKQFTFTIESVDNRRVKRVKITLNE